MISFHRTCLAAFGLAASGLALATALGGAPALAQSRNVPNALQGFATNRDQPIRIDANNLEVMDQQKRAVFSGNVVVQQGDTTLRCKELVVYYDGKEAEAAAGGQAGAKAGGAQGTAQGGQPSAGQGLAAGNPMSSSAIRRLEINGSVVVTTKEQTATGDQGIFENRSNMITLTGNPVVLTSGPNVIRGKKLTVDLTSGTSRFEGGRVESLIVPNSMKGMEAPGAAPKPRP